MTGKEFFKPLCVPLQDHLNNAGQYYVFVETNFYKEPFFEMLTSHCASLGVELSEVHYDPIIRSHSGEINLALQSLGEGFLLLLKHLEEENLLSGMFEPKDLRTTRKANLPPFFNLARMPC